MVDFFQQAYQDQNLLPIKNTHPIQKCMLLDFQEQKQTNRKRTLYCTTQNLPLHRNEQAQNTKQVTAGRCPFSGQPAAPRVLWWPNRQPQQGLQ